MFEKINSGKHNAPLSCMFILSISFSSFLVFFFITQSIEIIIGISQILSLDLGNKLSKLLYF